MNQSPRPVMRKGKPWLLSLIDEADFQALRSVAKANPDEIDAAGDDGVTPLMAAARIGHTLIVQALLNAGANVNLVDSQGRNALHYTKPQPLANNLVARLLLEAGVDPNQRDAGGESPMTRALRNSHFSLARVIVGAGGALRHSETDLLRLVREHLPREAKFAAQLERSMLQRTAVAGRTCGRPLVAMGL